MVIWTVSSMRVSPLVRAEKLSPDRDLARNSSGVDFGASSQKKNFFFIINPTGASGKTGQEWKKIEPYLKLQLSRNCNLYELFTTRPWHAVELTRKAIREGADAVIAVGGDGTLNEVVNGFFEGGKPVSSYGPETGCSTALGLIPVGTGSDFSRTFGWSNNTREAIDRVARGKRSKIDVAVVSGGNEEHRYFINVSSLHLSARSSFYASQYKRFGNLCYVFGALRAFIGHKNLNVRVKIDDYDWEVLEKITTICIGNAKFYGGGMKITPTASPMSGDLQAVIVRDFQWYNLLVNLPKLYNGSHLSLRNVSTQSIQSIEVHPTEHNERIYVECDGEFIGFLPRRFSIIPKSIEMFL